MKTNISAVVAAVIATVAFAFGTMALSAGTIHRSVEEEPVIQTVPSPIMWWAGSEEANIIPKLFPRAIVFDNGETA